MLSKVMTDKHTHTHACNPYTQLMCQISLPQLQHQPTFQLHLYVLECPVVCFCTSSECSHLIWKKHFQKLYAETAPNRLRTVGYISMCPADLSCLGCPPSGAMCVLHLSNCFFASSPSVVTSKWGKKGDEENRVGSSAPFHLTHVKNYTRGTTRRLTVMRTGEEN